jgi:hypothetical protein
LALWQTESTQKKRAKNSELNLIPVKVPAIIERGIFEIVQAKLRRNQQDSSRNLKHGYLCNKRVTCGVCGYKMISRPSNNTSGKIYQYYACPSGRIEYNSLHNVKLPNFRADHVDAHVWEWVSSILKNKKLVDTGWKEHRQRQAQTNAPLHRRLELIDRLIAEHKGKFDRLLDLYVSGDIPKDVLTDRKARPEAEILALEHERQSIQEQLEENSLTEEQIKGINEFLDTIREELPHTDLKTKREIFRRLDVQVELNVEDGHKISCAKCTLDKKNIDLRSVSFML